jgi:ribosomal protein S18 acetylase RimI-like enzyme
MTLTSPNVKIRRATISDAEPISVFAARIFEQTFGAMNSPEDMRAYVARSFNVPQVAHELTAEGSTFFIAESLASLVGYARTAAGEAPVDVRGERPIELVRLYVAQPYQGAGVAARLMQECIDDAKARGHGSMYLGVWEHNPRAQAFYHRRGFDKVGEERFELGHDIQTDWIMERAL